METMQKIIRGIAFIMVVLMTAGILNQSLFSIIQPIVLVLVVILLLLYAYTRFKQKNIPAMVTISMLAVFIIIVYIFSR